jgi:hypothetical protein
MKKLLLTGVALIAASSLAYTMAVAAPAKQTRSHVSRSAGAGKVDKPLLSRKSSASRMALCRADCRPDNYHAATGIGMHGMYRDYSKFDPHLTSIEGRKQYAQCVKSCYDPLPAVFVQRAVFGLGMKWFGKTKESCLDCHAAY